MIFDASMSEVHCTENDGETGKESGISENNENDGETMTSFPSINNDAQHFSVADERKFDMFSTEVGHDEKSVEEAMSPATESESYAVLGTSEKLTQANKLSKQGE